MLLLSCPYSASNRFVKTRRSVLINEVYKSRSCLFLNGEERSKLLRMGLVKNNFSSKSNEKIQLSLISDKRNTFSNLCLEFLNSCFRIEPEYFGKEFALENELLETAVNAWIWTGKEAQRHGTLMHRKMRSIISLMLTHSLKNDTVKAACLLSLIQKYPESLVLDLCLDFSTEEESLIVAERDFLNTILRTDSYRFMGHMLSCLQDMGPRLLNAWKKGYLDDSFGILLRQAKPASDMSKSLSAVVASQASKRFIASLASTEIEDLDGITPLLNLILTIFETKSTSAIDTHLIARELMNFFTLCRKRQSIQGYGDGTRSICKFGMCILEYLQSTGEHMDEQTKELSSELFCFLFAALPVIMKKNVLQKARRLQSDLVLTWLIRLIRKNSDHLDLSKIEKSIYQKVSRVCLKHGVAVGYDDENIPMLSLQFMALLIERMHKDCPASPTSPTAREVFEMVVSHSKFKQLFTDVESGIEDTITAGPKAKDHVIKLMITCVTISSEDIQIKSDVWKIIFASFNAGISHGDVLIRHLVSISSDDSLPFIDEVHWKGCNLDNRDQTLTGNQTLTGKLDWLIDALHPTRIRASISRFPIFDRLDLAFSLNEIWTEQLFDRNHEQMESLVEIDQPLSCSFKPKKVSYSADIRRRDREASYAEQYSPAFLLPLLLKTIELALSRNKKMTSNEFQTSRSIDDENRQELILPWNFSKSSIESIQRLCEKEIVSICLMSLSSLCEKVRCYAVSILGLILQACRSNYALDSPSWRDRPQLVMILNSVQRCLVIQKALNEGDSMVQRVAPVVATFLARAATVLRRPDDALYVPMNRYFLKNEANHGAFQDMKRLPAFMSLFCSSSEDANQSRAERMWGLQVLCDGLADASCYKLVTSCHAPELILSSFENIRLSKASDEAKGAEICLLLDSLRSMIEHGEYGAHIHLIRRCGLLSWMSSMCSTRSLSVAFPTERSRISFCQLANSAVERVFCTPQLRSFELIDEVCSLIQPIVSFCLIKGQSREPSQGIYQASTSTLHTLAIGLRNLKEERILCPDILPLGVSLESSLHLLRIADDSMKEQSLHTLCCLPFSLTRDLEDETAQNLILLMLDYFGDIPNDHKSSSSMDEDSDQLLVLLLQRIFLLIEQSEIVLPSKKMISSDIVTKIFALRCHQRFSEVNVRKLWSQSLKLLTQKVYSGGLEIESLEETIRKEISKRSILSSET